MTRILAVSHTPVWPQRSGSAIRRLMSIEALAGLGAVDLLYVGEVDGLSSAVPHDGPVRRVIERPVPRRRLSRRQRALWAAWPNRPLQVLEWEPGHGPMLPGDSYDVVWFFRALAFSLAGEIDASTVVVDLDDLEDEKLRLAQAVGPRHPSLRRRLAEHRNALAWHRYQNQIASTVDAVAVCTDEDRRKIGHGNAFVLPNGFPSVNQAHGPRADRLTMIFVGLFEYEPNADAAEFMVREILPQVRQVLPEAELRLVGRTTPRVERLRRPGVTVVGEVSDLSAEYARAALAVAPIRFGGGTRIKILEAFARRIPVVSTTMGAAGLGANHHQELLVADSAESFAGACTSLLSDDALRERISGGAYELYERRFDQRAVGRYVEDVVTAARTPPS